MGIFRRQIWTYYDRRRYITTSTPVAVDVSVIGVSKNHPSRSIMLRDGTFRPPYLHYYQHRHTMAFTAQAVSTVFAEVLFKGMWRGMYRSMR